MTKRKANTKGAIERALRMKAKRAGGFAPPVVPDKHGEYLTLEMEGGGLTEYGYPAGTVLLIRTDAFVPPGRLALVERADGRRVVGPVIDDGLGGLRIDSLSCGAYSYHVRRIIGLVLGPVARAEEEWPERQTMTEKEKDERTRALYHELFYGNSTYFEIRIPDDALIDVGIPKNSAVNFRRSVTFRDGDLIAARTPGGLFVALAYYAEGGRVQLKGAHPKCPVRTYLRREVKVLGIAHPVAEDDGLAWPEYICVGGAV